MNTDKNFFHLKLFSVFSVSQWFEVFSKEER